MARNGARRKPAHGGFIEEIPGKIDRIAMAVSGQGRAVEVRRLVAAGRDLDLGTLCSSAVRQLVPVPQPDFQQSVEAGHTEDFAAFDARMTATKGD